MRKAILPLLLLMWSPAPDARAQVVPLFQPRAAVLQALNDADQLAKEDQPFQRYLYQPDLPYDQTFAHAQRLGVNLISRESQLAYPKRVVPGLYRIDLRDFAINPKVYERLADIDPYFHRKQLQEVVEEVEVPYERSYGYYDAYGNFQHSYYKTEYKKQKKVTARVRNLLYAPQAAGQLASLALLLETQAPIVRADWFLVQTARQISLNNQQTGAGYYDFLEVKDRNDYFKLIGQHTDQFNSKVLIQSVVGESGISAQNRIIQRDGCDTGAHWTTLDTFDQSKRGVAINHLRAGEFQHNAEEHYAPLPNGLPGTFLSDDKGNRQDSAPDKLGGNRSPANPGADLRIHVNISCMQCHNTAQLMGIEDSVRPIYTGRLNVNANDKFLSLELRRQYGANLNRVLDTDRAIYQDAVSLAAGKPLKEAVQTYSEAYTKYAYGRVTLQVAATELGVTPPALLKALRDGATRLGSGDFRFDPFLADPPRPIQRLTFEDGYQDLQDVVYGILQPQPGGQ